MQARPSHDVAPRLQHHDRGEDHLLRTVRNQPHTWGAFGLPFLFHAIEQGGIPTPPCSSAAPSSSSRRGRQALLELTTWSERGYDLAITPDGPRGPCYEVQAGVMSLAQITGRPIIPFSYHLQWKLRPRTWDRFQIPLPFSRCEMILEKALDVPRETSDTKREALRQQLEQTLRSISTD